MCEWKYREDSEEACGQTETDRHTNVGKPDVLFIHKELWSKFVKKKFEERGFVGFVFVCFVCRNRNLKHNPFWLSFVHGYACMFLFRAADRQQKNYKPKCRENKSRYFY